MLDFALIGKIMRRQGRDRGVGAAVSGGDTHPDASGFFRPAHEGRSDQPAVRVKLTWKRCFTPTILRPSQADPARRGYYSRPPKGPFPTCRLLIGACFSNVHPCGFSSGPPAPRRRGLLVSANEPSIAPRDFLLPHPVASCDPTLRYRSERPKRPCVPRSIFMMSWISCNKKIEKESNFL